MSDFLELVGANIRYYRKQKGITQEELAEKTGLQNTYIGGIERGERNISLETLHKISIGLEISPMQIFNFQKLDIDNIYINKDNLLHVHLNLLQDRNNEEIKLIHNTVKNILILLDSKANK